MDEEKIHCDGCFYYGGYNRFSACCNYYLMTGKRRPPKTGKKCPVRLDKKENNKKKHEK